LPNIVGGMPAGKEVAVTIIRKGKELMKTVKVAQLDDTDEQVSFNSNRRDASDEMSLAVDRKSETAGMDIEIQQPVSSVPAFVVPAPARFGKRHMDHLSKVSQG
jgi:serine protease Do